MEPGEKENYLAELRGEDTIDNLRKELNELYFKYNIMEKVINRHNLKSEVEDCIKKAKGTSERLEATIKNMPKEELPFD